MVKQQIADNNFSKLILSKDELNESRNAFFLIQVSIRTQSYVGPESRTAGIQAMEEMA